jgi:catechol 2,3-dioxygenase-like lactoylglutathione lyase family enzyme
METRSLDETIPVLTDFLAFERVGAGSDSVILKHPNTSWSLTVHEGGPNASVKQANNHYGVRVLANDEIGVAHTYLQAHASEYGLTNIEEPEFQHGSLSVYFTEPGTNTLEIECYESVNQKQSGAERLGGVRSPHWTELLPADRFPGRGYVPQALTHGTLAIADPKVSVRFYTEALGLEAHNAYGDGRVTYIKHPSTKHYIVCARREERLPNPETFRYTLTVESPEALAEAHRWLSEHRDDFSITELHEIRSTSDADSFLVRDPDTNWWEITASR